MLCPHMYLEQPDPFLFFYPSNLVKPELQHHTVTASILLTKCHVTFPKDGEQHTCLPDLWDQEPWEEKILNQRN